MAGILTDKGERGVLLASMQNLPALTVRLCQVPFVVFPEISGPVGFEADFDGYAPEPLIFDALEPGNPGGRAVADFIEIEWTCTGNATPNLIYGYWCATAGFETWIAERFTGNPRPMRVAGQKVKVKVHLRLFSPV